MGTPKIANITDATFQTVITEADRPVLVYFHADWCGPCRVMYPKVENIALEFGDEISVQSARAEDCKKTVARYGIRVVPTLCLFYKGKLEGVRMKNIEQTQISAFVSELLSRIQPSA